MISPLAATALVVLALLLCCLLVELWHRRHEKEYGFDGGLPDPNANQRPLSWKSLPFGTTCYIVSHGSLVKERAWSVKLRWTVDDESVEGEFFLSDKMFPRDTPFGEVFSSRQNKCIIFHRLKKRRRLSQKIGYTLIPCL